LVNAFALTAETHHDYALPVLGAGDWCALDRIGTDRLAALRHAWQTADPFPHLVIDGLFDPGLLAGVERDFDAVNEADWRESRHRLQRKRGTTPGVTLPDAARHYFDQLAGAPMRRFLSAITGIESLSGDPDLVNGGLHQVPGGGSFELHVDFAFHPMDRRKTRLAMITYLNRGWLADWEGALELWSWKPRERRVSILPEFGRTLIMEVGPRNVHGHPRSVRTPDGRPRRSAAAYFYTERAREEPWKNVTGYIDRPDAPLDQRAIRFAQAALPSAIARGARRLFGRRLGA